MIENIGQTMCKYDIILYKGIYTEYPRFSCPWGILERTPCKYWETTAMHVHLLSLELHKILWPISDCQGTKW